MVTIYKVYDEDFSFYGDFEDIKKWLLEVPVSNGDLDEEELKEQGVFWGLEVMGMDYKEVYNKELKK